MIKKLAFLRYYSIVSITLLLFTTSYAQTGLPVSGKVTGSESSESLAGVTISVKGSDVATQSASDGSYQITVPSANSVLVFSYVGYTEQEVAVSNRSVVNIA